MHVQGSIRSDFVHTPRDRWAGSSPHLVVVPFNYQAWVGLLGRITMDGGLVCYMCSKFAVGAPCACGMHANHTVKLIDL